jgi:hypothetical protein
MGLVPTVTAKLRLGPAVKQGSSLYAFIVDPKSWVVSVLALISLVELIIFQLITANSRPLFSGAGNIANLASDLSVGYASGWIFYYLVSWCPQRKSRNLIILQAGPRVVNVFGAAHGLLDNLRRCANDSSTGPITVEELSALCHNLRLTGSALAGRINGQIVDLMGYWRQRTTERIASIDAFSLYLEPELLALLTHITLCSYFGLVDLALINRADQDLLFVVPSMYEYFVMADQLAVFVGKNYNGILDGRPLNMGAVSQMRAASGPVTWRPGSIAPWEARNEPPPWEQQASS